MLSAARKALWGDRRFWELEQCCRCFYKPAEVRRHKKSGRVRFDGLVTCGRVHICALCSDKIARRREREIKKLINLHQAKGGSVISITLTTAHHHDPLKGMLAGLTLAWDMFKKTASYKRLVKQLGFKHNIRRTEITFSFENGFHPHFHVYLFIARPEDQVTDDLLAEIDSSLFDAWYGVCAKVGLGLPSEVSGVNARLLQNADTAAWYMIKSNIPSAALKDDAMSIWTLLWLFHQGDKRALPFIEQYADATYRKQMYRPSNDLMVSYGLSKETDEQVLRKYHEDWPVVLGLTPEEMSLMTRYNLLERLMEAGRNDPEGGIQSVFDEYRNKDQGHKRSPIRDFPDQEPPHSGQAKGAK